MATDAMYLPLPRQMPVRRKELVQLTHARIDLRMNNGNSQTPIKCVGQQILEGVSWDLVWVFVVAGFVCIIVHAVYVKWRNKLRKRNASGE